MVHCSEMYKNLNYVKGMIQILSIPVSCLPFIRPVLTTEILKNVNRLFIDKIFSQELVTSVLFIRGEEGFPRNFCHISVFVKPCGRRAKVGFFLSSRSASEYSPIQLAE